MTNMPYEGYKALYEKALELRLPNEFQVVRCDATLLAPKSVLDFKFQFWRDNEFCNIWQSHKYDHEAVLWMEPDFEYDFKLLKIGHQKENHNRLMKEHVEYITPSVVWHIINEFKHNRNVGRFETNPELLLVELNGVAGDGTLDIALTYKRREDSGDILLETENTFHYEIEDCPSIWTMSAKAPYGTYRLTDLIEYMTTDPASSGEALKVVGDYYRKLLCDTIWVPTTNEHYNV